MEKPFFIRRKPFFKKENFLLETFGQEAGASQLTEFFGKPTYHVPI